MSVFNAFFYDYLLPALTAYFAGMLSFFDGLFESIKDLLAG